MQDIARRVGYSETAFVQSSDVADFKVRFFTPVSEVDLCGHATIATFSLLSHLRKVRVGRYSQETKAGILEIQIFDSGKVFMTQSKPAFGEFVERAKLAGTLNIDVQSLHSDLCPQIISTGLRDIIIPVKDLKTLNKIKPNFNEVSKISKQFDVIGYHLFSLETLFGATAHCRNLAPLYDIPEEAATGTASGALASYLFAHKIIDTNQANCLKFEQGYSMNRPSQIEARLEIANGGINKVEVGGYANRRDSMTILPA